MSTNGVQVVSGSRQTETDHGENHSEVRSVEVDRLKLAVTWPVEVDRLKLAAVSL